MLGILKWLFRPTARDRVERFHDPVLGELVLTDLQWECTVTHQAGSIIFRIGGTHEPAPELVSAVCDIVNDIEAFTRRVTDYLRSEADQSRYAGEADEISSLKIQDVNFWWPDKPTAGMIFFEGPDEFRGWHCDIDGSRLYGLTFDS